MGGCGCGCGCVGVGVGVWALDVIKTCILCSVAISVSFRPIQYSVAEGNRTTVTLVTNSSAYNFSFTVSLMFMDDTATSGSDYVPMPVSVTFSPEEEELSFEVMATEDDVAEQMERFKIVITGTNESTQVIVGSDDTAFVNIEDDDGELLAGFLWCSYRKNVFWLVLMFHLVLMCSV